MNYPKFCINQKVLCGSNLLPLKGIVETITITETQTTYTVRLIDIPRTMEFVEKQVFPDDARTKSELTAMIYHFIRTEFCPDKEIRPESTFYHLGMGALNINELTSAVEVYLNTDLGNKLFSIDRKVNEYVSIIYNEYWPG